jgi:hypothetical protein
MYAIMPVMPRIEKPQSSDVPATIAKINHFCELNGVSTNQLAHIAGVRQSALFRFLNNDRKTVTAAASEALKVIDAWPYADYAKIKPKELDKYTVSEIIKTALALWDGDPDTLGILSDFLKAMAPLYQVVLANRHRPR